MSFIYTRAELKSRINAGIQGKIGMLVSEDDLVNEVVRGVYGKVDFSAARRSAALTPGLNDALDAATAINATPIITP